MDKYIVFDTEVCNCPKINGQLDTHNGQVYDIGFQVIDASGRIYERYSIINSDVFFDMPQAMSEAFFADKIPDYNDKIHNHDCIVMNTVQIYWLFRQVCRRHNIKACVAHNAHFDITVLNATLRYQTKSKYRWFIPYGIPVMDTMKMANATICKTDSYKTFCKDNNYMTNHATPQVRKTAEIIWRYITNNNTFEEKHTGIEDVMIESLIFLRCLQHERA